MTTSEKLKSTYRVCQVGDTYYIQRKKFFGWSYNTGSKGNGTQGFLILFLLVLVLLFLISIVVAIFKMEYNPGMLITSIASIITFSIYTLLNLNSKSLSTKRESLEDAEDAINNKVDSELYELEEKEKNKQKKYQYFYTENQLRAKKLKKLK